MQPIQLYESEVRSYCRKFECLFVHARGSYIYDAQGNAYLDFWSSAGSVNYGHNPTELKEALIAYLQEDGLCAALDMYTHAKQDFIEVFAQQILRPRGLNYKMQFTGPTGTSVIESAVKLARKATGRRTVAAFTNGFHGMTGVSLGLTGNRYHRQPWSDSSVVRLPYEGYMGGTLDSVAYFERLLLDNSSGIDIPAAVVLETVQGEGGINVASSEWLRRLRDLTLRHDIPLIVDDIQAGCGRTGHFFSFEEAGITPDLVCMSKSLSGFGLPFSLLLMAPSLDRWRPGEDNGTFRGNSLAFVTAAQAIRSYWSDSDLGQRVRRHGTTIELALQTLLHRYGDDVKAVRGRGMFWGLELHDPEVAGAIASECFRRRLVVETCGADDQVVKVMPALTIDDMLLAEGMRTLSDSMDAVLGQVHHRSSAARILDVVA